MFLYFKNVYHHIFLFLFFLLSYITTDAALSLITHTCSILSHPHFSHTITALRPSALTHTHHSPFSLTLFIIHTLRQSLLSLHPTLPLLAIHHSLTPFSVPSTLAEFPILEKKKNHAPSYHGNHSLNKALLKDLSYLQKICLFSRSPSTGG